MITLQTERLILRMGYQEEPDEVEIKESHKRYMKGFNEPDCPLDVLRTEVLHEYFATKKGLAWGRFHMALKQSS